MRISALRRWNLVALLLLVSGLSQSAESATLNFVSGTLLNIGSDTNCANGFDPVLQDAWVGYSERNLKIPAVGEVWYAHVVVGEVGNPCPEGGSYTDVEISLPPSTTFAISADNPVFCAVMDSTKHVNVYNRQNQGCPQAPLTGFQTGFYDFPAYIGSQAQLWPIATGTALELMIPMRSTAPMSGQQIFGRIENDQGFKGYPEFDFIAISSDEVFRTDFENDSLYPDLCVGAASCTLVP